MVGHCHSLFLIHKKQHGRSMGVDGPPKFINYPEWIGTSATCPSRLTGRPARPSDMNRFQICRDCSGKWGCICDPGSTRAHQCEYSPESSKWMAGRSRKEIERLVSEELCIEYVLLVVIRSLERLTRPRKKNILEFGMNILKSRMTDGRINFFPWVKFMKAALWSSLWSADN